MRHRFYGNHLGRSTNGAKALYRGLTIELFDHGRIETTVAKAKAIVPMVDKVLTFAKKNSVSARREVVKLLGSEKILDKIFTEIAPKYSNRHSGFSRLIRLGPRFSDSAKMTILELVEGVTLPPVVEEQKKTITKTKSKR